jgi:plastocyanin
MRNKHLLGVAMLVTIATSCGGSDDPGPTGNNNPVPASIVVTLSGTSPITAIGDTRTLTASVRDANQAVISGAPVTFTTSSASIATVTGNASGATVTATGNGTATITATSGSDSQPVTVTVEQRLSNVVLNTTPIVMGSTAQLAPAARDSRNVPIPGVTGFTITSATPAVAVVTPAGLATGISPGNATLNVSITRDGVTANATGSLTVNPPAPAGASVTVTASPQSLFTPQTVTVERGGTVNWIFQTLTHTVAFSTPGSPANISESVNTTVSRVFPTVGTYNYECTIHQGMTGSVVVTTSGFFGSLSGANEKPTATNSTGTGAASFLRNNESVNFVVTFQGLTGVPTGAHLHGPAGSNDVADILVEFSTAGLTANSGAITGSFTASAIRGVNGQPPMTLDALIALLQSGNAYVNVHTAQFPNGEIRGQIAPP